jgi:hypothetical protein
VNISTETSFSSSKFVVIGTRPLEAAFAVTVLLFDRTLGFDGRITCHVQAVWLLRKFRSFFGSCRTAFVPNGPFAQFRRANWTLSSTQLQANSDENAIIFPLI